MTLEFSWQILIFVVPCIMLNSEINPTRCNNCVYSAQWLYSYMFRVTIPPIIRSTMLYMASGRQVYCKLTKSVITIIFDTTANMQSQVFYHTNPTYYPLVVSLCLLGGRIRVCFVGYVLHKLIWVKPLRRINTIVASCWIYFTILDRCSKNSQIFNFMKIRPVGAKLFHVGGRTGRWTDRQTDRQTWRS